MTETTAAALEAAAINADDVLMLFSAGIAVGIILCVLPFAFGALIGVARKLMKGW